MATISITIGGVTYNHDATAAEVSGLTSARMAEVDLVVLCLPDDAAEEATALADDETYLQGVLAAWKADNPSGDVQQCIADALASWSGEPRPLSPEAERARLVAYAASRRYQAEVAGCLDPDGRAIATDRDSQTKLIAEMVAIGAGLRTDPSGWKLRGNGFALLTNAEMQAAILAARSHIAAAFAVEAAVLAGIAADAITTTAEIDAADWPA